MRFIFWVFLFLNLSPSYSQQRDIINEQKINYKLGAQLSSNDTLQTISLLISSLDSIEKNTFFYSKISFALYKAFSTPLVLDPPALAKNGCPPPLPSISLAISLIIVFAFNPFSTRSSVSIIERNALPLLSDPNTTARFFPIWPSVPS